MRRGVRFAAFGSAVVVVTALTACGPSSSSSSSSAVTQPCNTEAASAGWSQIYSVCENSSGTFTRLTNTSEWDVLLLQVPQGSVAPIMSVGLPQESSLADLVEQKEFFAPIGSDYALVPPGATLSSSSADATPVHLTISVDFSSTAENVSALGLVDVVEDKVNPTQSEAQAIVTCANYVRGLPEQINQSQPSSPQFWNNFADTAECSNAFSSASDALGTAESTILDDAEDATSDFFDDILPKLISLAADTIFG